MSQVAPFAGRQRFGLIVQMQFRLAASVADHFHIGPANVADASAQRLAHRFFDGKTTRETGKTAVTIPNLLCRKKPLQKAVAVPGNAPLNPGYFNHVYTNG